VLSEREHTKFIPGGSAKENFHAKMSTAHGQWITSYNPHGIPFFPDFRNFFQDFRNKPQGNKLAKE
jgi:hypothetical protein